MTFEERAEFLMQSIESHDRQLAEVIENGAKTDARIDALTVRLDTLGARVDALTASTQLLMQAMAGLVEHTANHARRIERLEA